MQMMIYRIAMFAASHGYAETFVRVYNVLARKQYALCPIRVQARAER